MLADNKFNPSAIPTSTNPNSLPCASDIENLDASAFCIPKLRARRMWVRNFSTINVKSPKTINRGAAKISLKSTPAPTAMKNMASSKPLKGCKSISSSWRYSLSASTTPARNVPSAADKPTISMTSVIATTSNNAVATKISLAPVSATIRKSGRVRYRPPNATEPTANIMLMAFNQAGN